MLWNNVPGNDRPVGVCPGVDPGTPSRLRFLTLELTLLNGSNGPLSCSIVALHITLHLQRLSCITGDLPVAVPIGVLAGETNFGDA